MLFIITFFLACALYCQDFPPIEDELDDIQVLLDEVENEVVEGKEAVPQAGQPLPLKPHDEQPSQPPEQVRTEPPALQPVQRPAAPAKKEWGAFGADSIKVKVEDASENGDIIDYGYIGKIDDGYLENGSWIFALNGLYAEYGSTGSSGMCFDFGWQYNIRFVSVALLTGIGYRRNSNFELYPWNIWIEPRFRVLSWLGLYGILGVEFTRISGGDFVYPFTMFGGGILLRMGSIDRKAEFSMYKRWGIHRTYLAVSCNTLKYSGTSSLSGGYLVKIGLSFEF
ncbi:MAG: hypothetical protein JXA66_02945 [Oligoflexia bacterium]|nr:hypothetical protein [Oligoflexia bacterium]